MKHYLNLSFLTLSCCLATTLQAIEITDYKEPVSTYEEAYISGRITTKSGNQDQTSFDTNLNLDYEKNFSSRERNLNLRADGFYTSSRGSSSGDDVNEDYEANGAAIIDNYLPSNPNIFWFGSGEVNAKQSADDLRAKAVGGMGYGRVTNATPLARAIRIVEELTEHNIINTAVSDAAYLRMAQVINREDEFRSKFGADEYMAKFVDAIDGEFKQSGVLPNGLGAAGTAHLLRVLKDERISVRKYGWLVRGGVGVLLQDFDGESGDPSLELGFEYAYPNGIYGQFINRLTYSAILKGSDQTDQSVLNRMSYTHELSDRIDWENIWSMDYVAVENGNDVLDNTLSSTFRYYLTNQLAVDATLSLNKVDDDITNGNEETDVTTFLGVTYRLK